MRGGISALLCIVVLAPAGRARAGDVTLAWDPNAETDLAGYTLYYTTTNPPAEPYTEDVADEASPVDIPLGALADPAAPRYTLTGIPSCTHVWFALTAYDTSGNESGFSNAPFPGGADPEVIEVVMLGRPELVASSGAREGTLQISWSGLSADDAAAISGYRVHYGSNTEGPYDGTGALEGDSPIEVDSAETSLLLNGLPPGETIYVKVEAVCSNDEVKLSAEQSAVVAEPECGNGYLEGDELCDGNCSDECDDGLVCTEDLLEGSVADCDAVCSNPTITVCRDGDGCCPEGCDGDSDEDCPTHCDDGVVDHEEGETCDPPSSCPTDCDDGEACTEDQLTGSAANCNAVCANSVISACNDGDGCCPPGCDHDSDGDCSDSCGDGVVDEDQGETCDPPSACPASCDDGDACTKERLLGSPQACSAVCQDRGEITACIDDDGCCPADCTPETDSDCAQQADALGALQGGCGCEVGPAPVAPLGLLLLVLLVLVRRERA